MLRAIQERLALVFSQYGYTALDTPLLENAELFLRKLGAELVVRMYAFTDPGGNRVGLRPECTASVVRRYLEIADRQPLPWRVQYAGPVFRYEPDGGRRQFTQAGVELLGSSGPYADAEILEMAVSSLGLLGLSGHTLVLGDAGMYNAALEQLHVTERTRLFILDSLASLREGEQGLAPLREKAQRLHLLPSQPGIGPDALAGLDEHTSRAVLHRFLSDIPGGLLGQRTPQEVEDRLLQRLRGDDPRQVEKGLEIACRLASVRGAPAKALERARDVIREYGLDSGALDRLQRVLEVLSLKGIPDGSLTVDLGLARGIAYYTGFVFEVSHPGRSIVLGGGGRYDTLVKELGHSTDVAALGFAFTLENVAEVLDVNALVGSEQELVLVVPEGEAAYRDALNVAETLRREGKAVEMELQEREFGDAMAYARERGISRVVVVDAQGKTVEHLLQGEGNC